MKKTIIFIILFFFIITGNYAQVQRQTDSSQTRMTNTDKRQQKLQMMQDLHLTSQQRGDMKEMRKSMKQQKDALKTNPNLTTEQKREKLKRLHKEQNEKLKKILTTEQQEQLKAKRKDKR